MKSTELMVGDLVLLFDETPARVDAIGDTEVYVYEKERGDWHVGYEHIKPIPLTPKILKKNGFTRTSDGWDCDENQILSLVIHEENEKCFDVWIAKPRDWKNLTYSLPLPKYVHELQHALRLCGIDKEITI